MLADLNLKQTVMVFDRNWDGKVSYLEFKELMKELDLGLTDIQIELFLRWLLPHTYKDGQGEARIDAAEFLGRFSVVYTKEFAQRSPFSEPWYHAALAEIGRQLTVDKEIVASLYYEKESPSGRQTRRRSSAMKSVALFQKYRLWYEENTTGAKRLALEALEELQSSGLGHTEEAENILKGIELLSSSKSKGYLTYDELVAWIMSLKVDEIEEKAGVTLTPLKLRRLARSLDSTQTGFINYLEFLSAFHVIHDDGINTSLTDDIVEQVCTTIFENKSALKKALRNFDPEGKGTVSSIIFKEALVSTNQAAAQEYGVQGSTPLSLDQIDSLLNSISSESRTFDYDNFLSSFYVTYDD